MRYIHKKKTYWDFLSVTCGLQSKLPNTILCNLWCHLWWDRREDIVNEKLCKWVIISEGDPCTKRKDGSDQLIKAWDIVGFLSATIVKDQIRLMMTPRAHCMFSIWEKMNYFCVMLHNKTGILGRASTWTFKMWMLQERCYFVLLDYDESSGQVEIAHK